MRGRGAMWVAGMLAAATAAGCGANGSPNEFVLVERYAAPCRPALPARPAPARERADRIDVPLLSWSEVMDAALQPIGPDEPEADGAGELATSRPKDPNVPAAAPAPAPALPPLRYQPWQVRRGPAYEGDWLRSWGRDGKEILPILWDDTKATFTDPWSLGGILAAGVVGIVVNGTGVDDTVADHYTKHGSQLNTFWDTVGDAGGNPGTHFAVAGAMYFGGLWGNDVKAYETSKTLINALIINDLFTVALKEMARTRSPNGDGWGWPSGHTSSSFCFATVLCEAYGPWVGVPLLLGAGYVGYERIDARNHDFSDVLSGALIGIAVGHAVAGNHKARIFGFEVVPWADPAGGVGLALGRRF